MADNCCFEANELIMLLLFVIKVVSFWETIENQLSTSNAIPYSGFYFSV